MKIKILITLVCVSFNLSTASAYSNRLVNKMVYDLKEARGTTGKRGGPAGLNRQYGYNNVASGDSAMQRKWVHQMKRNIANARKK